MENCEPNTRHRRHIAQNAGHIDIRKASSVGGKVTESSSPHVRTTGKMFGDVRPLQAHVNEGKGGSSKMAIFSPAKEKSPKSDNDTQASTASLDEFPASFDTKLKEYVKNEELVPALRSILKKMRKSIKVLSRSERELKSQNNKMTTEYDDLKKCFDEVEKELLRMKEKYEGATATIADLQLRLTLSQKSRDDLQDLFDQSVGSKVAFFESKIQALDVAQKLMSSVTKSRKSVENRKRGRGNDPEEPLAFDPIPFALSPEKRSKMDAPPSCAPDGEEIVSKNISFDELSAKMGDMIPMRIPGPPPERSLGIAHGLGDIDFDVDEAEIDWTAAKAAVKVGIDNILKYQAQSSSSVEDAGAGVPSKGSSMAVNGRPELENEFKVCNDSDSIAALYQSKCALEQLTRKINKLKRISQEKEDCASPDASIAHQELLQLQSHDETTEQVIERLQQERLVLLRRLGDAMSPIPISDTQLSTSSTPIHVHHILQASSSSVSTPLCMGASEGTTLALEGASSQCSATALPPALAPAMVRISIKSREGKVVSMDINGNESMENIKAHIEAATGVPFYQQRLFCGGERLHDGRTLLEYYIQHKLARRGASTAVSDASSDGAQASADEEHAHSAGCDVATLVSSQALVLVDNAEVGVDDAMAVCTIEDDGRGSSSETDDRQSAVSTPHVSLNTSLVVAAPGVLSPLSRSLGAVRSLSELVDEERLKTQKLKMCLMRFTGVLTPEEVEQLYDVGIVLL